MSNIKKRNTPRYFVILISLLLLIFQIPLTFMFPQKASAGIENSEGFSNPVYQSIHKGEMYSTGNVNLGVKIPNEVTRNNALYSEITEKGTVTAPNQYMRELIDVDNDPTTTNSSKAYIPVPENAEIEWAGLYWSSTRYLLKPEQYQAPIKLTIPKGKTFQISPERTHQGSGLLYGFGIDGTFYSNYADITNTLKLSNSKGGSYTVADIPYPSTGYSYASGYYSFAGWYMLVITKDKTKNTKAFTVYDGGLKRASGSGTKEFVMKDFIASKTGKLEPKVSMFAVQGDRYWTGDRLEVFSNGKWNEITDPLNPTSNIFNSTISEYGEHMRDKYPGQFSPDYKNNLGIDADLIALPEETIKPGQKEVKLRASTSGDDYVLNTLAFSVNVTLPELVIEKSIVNQKESYESDEEVTYRLNIKNTEKDSKAVDTKVEDILDSRLEFVPGSIRIVSGPNSGEKTDRLGDDQAEYDSKARKIIVRIGEGANQSKGGTYSGDTPETTIEFKAKVKSQEQEVEIPNQASVSGIDEITGRNIEKSDSNNVLIKAKPKKENIGKLEATKLVKNLNGEKYRVGDRVEYTIKAKNIVQDSILKAVKITDKLPEGVEYIPNTLKLNGILQSDSEDGQAYIKDDIIYANLGELNGEQEKEITFEVVIKEAAANKKIKNIAVVETTDLPDPVKPEVEIEVERIKGALIARKEVKSPNGDKAYVGDELEYTVTVNNVVENGEVRNANIRVADVLPKGLSYIPESIQVDGKSVTDAVDLDNGQYENGTVVANFGTIYDQKEHKVTFKAKVTKEGLQVKEIVNIATVDGTDPDGNPLPPIRPEAKIKIDSKSGEIEAKKEVINVKAEKVALNDEIEYKITARNKIENTLIKNMRITDEIPAGTEYVKGSMNVDGQPVTDEVDKDAGTYDGNTIKVNLGDVADTKERIITFKVKITHQALKQKKVKNVAIVEGQTPEEDELPPVKPEVETLIHPQDPKVTKTVSDTDEKNVEKASLKTNDEEFTWSINYDFGSDTTNVERIVLKDHVESVLEILEVWLVDGNNETIKVNAKIDEQENTVTIELPKKDGSYTYLEGQRYTMHIKSKLIDGLEISEIFTTEGIPNQAELLFDEKTTQSNKAKVIPPKSGKIEIEKVDAKDPNIRLKDAKFQIIDKYGKEVEQLITDENGKAVSNQLLLGKYTIKEIQAPHGYMLLRDSIEIEITSESNVKKLRIENTKSDWIIPETGGVGTIIFYIIGGILMLCTVVIFLRRRSF
ncbi:isopeptide-forming domain-containing fimbrial protein [Bacillus sp. AS_5]|nr:isopeptide-forming domain-containing fimbrial protein [Bacillus sp. AS_3]MCX2699551.1 isopeptide-forming domain-containing fimbrial protein [Bacillus sp. AS_5]